MARDVMAVRLHLAQIRVLEVVEDTPGALVVSVESTLLRLRAVRVECGFKCRRVHDRRAKRVRDLEVSGRRMTLVWQRRRMVCSNCASRFLEDHPAFEGALTARLARRVVADAKVMTFSAAARRHGVHWHAVRALVDTWSALVAERRRSRRCAVLLVDETSMRKRHRYVTVIVNGDTGRTLAMVEHRSSAALSAFLMQQGHRWCKGVKVVVSDGSKAYKAAIDAHLGHARHVLDRFHVIRWFAAGLTQVRRDVQRRPEGSKPAFDPEVFRARFALLRRGDTLASATSRPGQTPRQLVLELGMILEMARRAVVAHEPAPAPHQRRPTPRHLQIAHLAPAGVVHPGAAEPARRAARPPHGRLDLHPQLTRRV